jgi:tetratricopeptide (TPR) repeat protein
MKSKVLKCPWLLVLAVMAPLARAQQPARTAVVVIPGDSFSEKSAAIANHVARQNFSRESAFTAIDVREHLLADADDPQLAAFRKAVEAVNQGCEQYNNLELDAAIDSLNSALEMFDKAVGRMGAGEHYLKALLYLGAAQILSGDNDQGAIAFRKAAIYDRRLVLDKKVFPPSLIEIFENVRQEVATLPPCVMQVNSAPAGAEIYLNGIFKGVTPLKLSGVPAGTHFLRLEKDGYLPWGRRVEFLPASDETVEGRLQAGPQLPVWEKHRQSVLPVLAADPPKAPLIELGTWLRAEKLVVASATQRRDELLLQAALIQLAPPKQLSLRQIELNITSPNFLNQLDAFFSSLYRQVDIPLDKTPGEKPSLAVATGKCNSDSDCSMGEVCDMGSGRCIPYAPRGQAFYEKWWFWTLVGGGLAVAGGTAALVYFLTRPEVGTVEFSF